MRLKFKLDPEPELEPEPGQNDGSGSSQIPRLRKAQALKPWFQYSRSELKLYLLPSFNAEDCEAVLQQSLQLYVYSPIWVLVIRVLHQTELQFSHPPLIRALVISPPPIRALEQYSTNKGSSAAVLNQLELLQSSS